MDLTEFIKAASDTQIPSVLILIGLALVLGVILKVDLTIGNVSLKLGVGKQVLAFFIGFVFFVIGSLMHSQINLVRVVADFHYASVSKEYERGNTLIFLGNYQEAVKTSVAILEDDPGYAPAWNQLAIALSQIVGNPNLKPAIQTPLV